MKLIKKFKQKIDVVNPLTTFAWPSYFLIEGKIINHTDRAYPLIVLLEKLRVGS